MTDFTYAAVVMDRGAPGDWRAHVRDALGEEGIRLVDVGDDEPELRGPDDHLLGWAHFGELSSAGDRPALAPWIAEGERPWMGRPAGLFRWNHPAADEEEKSCLIRAVARGARGGGWRTEIRRSCESSSRSARIR